MQVSTSIEIAKPKVIVWTAITDIENSAKMISSIISIELLQKPDNGLVGLKWQETRKMFGKEASETMWITEAQENAFYATRAESHGSVYVSRLSLQDSGSGCILTMAFSGEAQSLVAKILSLVMGFFIRGSVEKAIQQDLADIKKYLEKDQT